DMLHIDEIIEVHIESPVTMRIFRQQFVFMFDQVMNLYPMAYRAKQKRNILDAGPHMSQSSPGSDHTCSTTETHGTSLLFNVKSKHEICCLLYSRCRR